jgi:periplasmic protein CpxP/Spy
MGMRVDSRLGLVRHCVEDLEKGMLLVQGRTFTLAYLIVVTIGMPCPGTAQDSGAQQSSAREQLQHIHTPQSIDQELAHLTKDLELTREQQQRVRSLLVEHRDRIQVLLDKNPTASRQELGSQIHAISNETHQKVHALLTDHQKELEKAMTQREHTGEENRRSTSPTGSSSQR